jgi:integration host factor subunit alpha
MMMYSLSGFALAGLRQPSFLIPYFVTQRGNGVFAQELDREFMITSFRRFSPDNYEASGVSPPPIPRQVGELGLLAYQLKPRGKVVYGDPQLLRSQLVDELPSIKGAEFFKLEAAMFIGLQERVAQAIIDSSCKFTNPMNEQNWIEIESAHLLLRHDTTSSLGIYRAEESTVGPRETKEKERIVTRADLCEAVYQKIGLSRTESAALVELVLKEITDCLQRGETVKLSSFGSFVVRKKGQRIGRNPKTGTEVQISPRRVMVFKPSQILRQRIGIEDSDTQVLRQRIGVDDSDTQRDSEG